VADRIEIRIGPAIETLRALPEREVFDFAFIDADKPSYPDYYEESLARLRPGGLIVLDNVLTSGAVLEGAPLGHYSEDSVATMRALNDRIRDDERVDVAMVGVADGLMLARKR
jgi:caffeoyl-CoA O-methyltransferase